MFSALTSKVYGGLAIFLALALVYVTVSKNGEIRQLTASIERPVTGWRARLDRCELDRQTLRGNQAKLEKAVTDHNASLDRIKAAADLRAANAANDRLRALEQAKTAEAKAATLAKRVAGSDVCKSARDLILEYTK